jgi:hypothetical protein
MKELTNNQKPESREEKDMKLNDQLRSYNKIAKSILETKSPQERMQNLTGLIMLIAEECKPFLDKDSSQIWDYTLITKAKGAEPVENKCKGAPDYELYRMAFENRTILSQFTNMLEKGELKGKFNSIAELEAHTLYSALNTELIRTKKEVQCMKRLEKKSPGVPDHFELDIPQIKQKLKKVLQLMKQLGYVEQSLTNNDFLYLCSGIGRPSTYPIKWLKDDDELGYFVKTFFKNTKNKYARATLCFKLNNGKTPDEKNLRTNATKQIDKQTPINALVKIIS